MHEGTEWAVLVGGDTVRPDPARHAKLAKRRMICADSGARLARVWDLVPDIICGDMDSLDPGTMRHFEAAGTQFMRFPAHKDLTDTELALDVILERGATDVVMMGMDGGRFDHLLTNYLVAGRYAHHMAIRVWSEAGESHYVTERDPFLILKGVKGKTLSMIPLETARGVDYQGLSYPLSDAVLDYGTGRGISNVAVEDRVEVRLKQGVLLVVVNG